jgi:hypothetical protein
MKNYFSPEHHTKRGVVTIACSTAVAAVLTVSMAQAAQAAPYHRARQSAGDS